MRHNRYVERTYKDQPERALYRKFTGLGEDEALQPLLQQLVNAMYNGKDFQEELQLLKIYVRKSQQEKSDDTLHGQAHIRACRINTAVVRYARKTSFVKIKTEISRFQLDLLSESTLKEVHQSSPRALLRVVADLLDISPSELSNEQGYFPGWSARTELDSAHIRHILQLAYRLGTVLEQKPVAFRREFLQELGTDLSNGRLIMVCRQLETLAGYDATDMTIDPELEFFGNEVRQLFLMTNVLAEMTTADRKSPEFW